MPQNIIKINKFNGYLLDYKLKSKNQFKISLTYDFEEAGLFDQDDYILELCKYWFNNNLEVFPVTSEEEKNQKEIPPNYADWL